MIIVKDGDILLATENVMCHQVNCIGKMGTGLAEQYRKKYPVVFYNYYALCQNENFSEKLLGHCQIVKVGNLKWVANLFGQYDISREFQMTDYRALATSLIYLRDKAAVHGYSIAIPYGIGCNLGGGDWDRVYGIIEQIFVDYTVTLYRYNPK
jgi:O-acetyl-ADP-ribose deacetylase (regulator of RNase III)